MFLPLLIFLPLCFIQQKGDECAEKIKLSYPGYNSSYSTVNNTPLVYELLLAQETTYDLTIHLKLSDGAEIIFWRQQYTTSIGKMTTPTVNSKLTLLPFKSTSLAEIPSVLAVSPSSLLFTHNNYWCLLSPLVQSTKKACDHLLVLNPYKLIIITLLLISLA